MQIQKFESTTEHAPSSSETRFDNILEYFNNFKNGASDIQSGDGP